MQCFALFLLFLSALLLAKKRSTPMDDLLPRCRCLFSERKFCFGDWYDNMVVWFWRCCFVQFQCWASLVVRFSSLPKLLEIVEFGHSDPLDRSPTFQGWPFLAGCGTGAVCSSQLWFDCCIDATSLERRSRTETWAKPIGLGRLWCSTSSEPSYHLVVPEPLVVPEGLVVRVQPPVHGWLGVSVRYI